MKSDLFCTNAMLDKSSECQLEVFKSCVKAMQADLQDAKAAPRLRAQGVQ